MKNLTNRQINLITLVAAISTGLLWMYFSNPLRYIKSDELFLDNCTIQAIVDNVSYDFDLDERMTYVAMSKAFNVEYVITHEDGEIKLDTQKNFVDEDGHYKKLIHKDGTAVDDSRNNEFATTITAINVVVIIIGILIVMLWVIWG